MAVFTKLSASEFSDIVSQYSIGQYVTSVGIAQGIENTNYFLDTKKDGTIHRYIFTIYEGRVDVDNLPFYMHLQEELHKNGYPCPTPIKNKQGEYIGEFKAGTNKGKKYSIVTKLSGNSLKQVKNHHIGDAAKELAFLHNLSTKLTDKLSARENNLSKEFWISSFSEIREQASKDYKQIENIFEQAINVISQKWPNREELPYGIIHGDYFPDNTLYSGSKITGVIDFYMACKDFYLYELAIALNAWCFEKDGAFNITKASSFLNSYMKVRPLSPVELAYLPTICIGASLRFLVSRLYDKYKTKSATYENAVVEAKDPLEYYNRLNFHLQVVSYKEYFL